ncbi:hypothetical protein HYH02_006591 [Chlamydomonas schloesseri]|uniref:ABC transporter domain-containing protein n=1 Tax=Chlamydomonas schloesseri TaxID=2026947 RepID=A0A835W6K6_9CHLO|nr:hypothetical protein HYH02_006591 [Chlamydomonas schloesseri]|eukprot:KAG2439064.1 hypothetical protein HYH02_006591 [Chlamydomonas schloesseri]
MADYKNAFIAEPNAIGVEGVFNLVPQRGAFTLQENDLADRLYPVQYKDEVVSSAPSAAAMARMSQAQMQRLTHKLSQLPPDEAALMEAAVDEAVHKRLRPLKELQELDKKMQAVDEQLKEYGGFTAALGARMKAFGVAMPSVTLEYRDLSVHTDALVGSAGIPSVGNSLLGMFKRLVCVKDHTVDHPILDKLSGVIRPGRPTLLLGPPASGKSSLLKVLAGRYRNGQDGLRITGDLHYNGHTQDEFVVERTTSLVNQHDNHIPTLTVMETLEFAHTCQLGSRGGGFDLPGELRKAIEKARADGTYTPPEHSLSDDELLKIMDETYDSGIRTLGAMRAMGISHTANTPVGDAMLRGVSGGERKRVTTAEMLVGPRRVLLLDEISTGLDSATLYSIADLLCKLCRLFGITLLVSLLQPPPEVYFLFDDVILTSAGHITYHGPPPGALPFYQQLGFVCPPRKDVPSFLQEITTASGQQEYASEELRARLGLRKPTAATGSLPLQSKSKSGASASQSAAPAVAPPSPQQPAATAQAVAEGAEGGEGEACSGGTRWVIPPAKVAEAFWHDTQAGRDMRALLEQPFDKAKGHPAALARTRYALTHLEALAVVVRRQMLLVARDTILIKGRLVQVIVMGLITGSLFFQLGDSVTDARAYFGVSFLAVMFMAMGAMPALPVTLATKGVWEKHRAALFYPAWCHALGANLAQVPMMVVDSFVYSIILYWMVGYTANAGQFFAFWLAMFSMSFNSNVLFRLIAYASPDAVTANAFGGFCLLILILLSGFAIIRGSIPDYWIWAYYISPFAWALRCVVINEFTSQRWGAPSPGDPSMTVGEEALGTFDFYTSWDWYWGGIGYLWGSALAFIVASTLALAYLTGEPPVARVADPDELEAARKKAAEARAKAAAVAASKASGAAHGAAAAAAAATVATASTDEGEVAVTVDVGKLPYTPITLVFEDLRYFVPNPSAGVKPAPGAEAPPARLELLKGITGFSLPGSMTALMGGSGAGKTTLMDVIAGRKTVGEITGNIWVNGHPKDQASWARSSGYVEQMDIHSPATTVLEALMFSARLRLPASVSAAAARAYVDSVISIVELDDVMFDLVGLPGASSGTGLNVDARKRLTLAVEMVANPSVVFMDEPTSGLDARAASVVMRAIRNVAADGRTIMVTIHQPSIEIFEAFDMLLLLQRGGRTTYFGSMGVGSKGLIDYLTGAIPGVEHLPEGYNPATWMLEVTGAAKAVRIKAVEGADWPALYGGSALAASNAAEAKRLVEESRKAHPEPLAVSGTYAASMWTQLVMLASKFRLAYWRTPSYNFVRIAMTVAVALVYGSVYWGEGNVPNPATTGSVQNVMGVLYSSSSFLGMTGMNSLMPLLGFERVVYYREQAAAMYNPWVYGFVLMGVETPYLISQVVLFVGVMYPMIDFFGSAAKFFYYFFMVFLTLMFYLGFASALVYITPSQQLAQVVGAAFNFLFNLFNGFVLPFSVIPNYYKWANRISPTTWVLYGLAVDQLGDNTNTLKGAGIPAGTTVSSFLQSYFGYDYDFRFWCLLIVVAYVVFFRSMGIVALRYVSFLKR